MIDIDNLKEIQKTVDAAAREYHDYLASAPEPFRDSPQRRPPARRPVKPRKRATVTVCIAAIAKWGDGTMVVGAADRLITWGDIEYEQSLPKIIRLTPSVPVGPSPLPHAVVMMAGDPEGHAPIVNRTWARLRDMNPPAMSVEVMATIYSQEFVSVRREKNERRFLAPLGLNQWNFLNQNNNLPPAVLQRLVGDMATELGCEAIIAGVDAGGAHVFVVDDNGIVNHDMQGWAAIGSGWRHANAQLIASKYDRFVPFDQAILQAYLAKKKADVTPGVGSFTDLFWVANEGYMLLNQDNNLVKFVKDLHQKMDASERRVTEKAKTQIANFVGGLVEPQPIATEETAPALAEPARWARSHTHRRGRKKSCDLGGKP